MSEVVKDPTINLNDLKLHLYAEFETWEDFVAAVDEFQKKTFIKLTIITSKKLKTVEANKRNKKMHPIIPEASDDEEENKMKGKKRKNKSRFEYQYLKLTCKHYGRYVSTSKGIRPNQKTAKLECPTFLYASYDNYKDKFIIKQMNISCNHELKDEDVALPKLLQKTITHENETSSYLTPASKEKKKYVKIQNRNVIKIPLESPTLGALIVNVNKRIKCTHEINSSCQAASLTNDDLMSIHSMFNDKKKKDQNDMIYDWVSLNDIEINNSTISRQFKQNKDDNEGAVLIQFKLPTLDGSLINVCFKAFTSILNITNARVNEVISDQYSKMTKRDHHDNNNLSVKNREIETSIATILTSFNNTNSENMNEQVLEIVDAENQQLMIIDTVDVPTTENTIEDAFNSVTGQALNASVTSGSLTNDHRTNDEVVTTSTIVPVEINEKRFELNSIPWWRQMGDDEELSPSIKEHYGKLDLKRCILILKLAFTENEFQTEIYAQIVDPCEHSLIAEMIKDYKSPDDAKSVLKKFDSLALCRGISDPQLKNYANEIKSNSNSTFTYCYYSDSVRSKSCELLYDDTWEFGMCRYCYSILDNVN